MEKDPGSKGDFSVVNQDCPTGTIIAPHPSFRSH